MGWIKMRADLDSCMREQEGMLRFMADLSSRLHACEKEVKRLKAGSASVSGSQNKPKGDSDDT